MLKLLLLSGSVTPNASTDILMNEVADVCVAELAKTIRVERKFVKLSEVRFIPCQACGEAPTPHWCFYNDLNVEYELLANCDALIFGSPIYFDNVSAQAKAFIDRCNCYRPYDFKNIEPAHSFLKLLPHKRPGAMVFVGGEHGWFEGARRTVAGFFKWVEVVSHGMVTFSHDDVRIGSVVESEQTMQQARDLGRKLAEALKEYHAGQAHH